ncbi:nucleobase:cation symporter-2 family protein [Pandoraea sputorum]|uniref:Purine permease n=1 Tax=Pandoraea sputorum TaxID=93222 RepID=A0A5E5BKS8_9BURK|nr:nucleobase:cation symporter-2 family protein [Pandoraea sputorum]VVE85722.1 purine permease [Pandoraea sputorum]
MTAETTASANQGLPPGKGVLLGLQHVLSMYASSVALPLMIGGALGLPKAQIAGMISAALFVGGVTTMIQSLGVGGFGIRLPIIMGVSYAGSGAIIAIGRDPRLGLAGVFGAMLIAGLLCIVLAPRLAKRMYLFPHVVVGSLLLTIGISLMDVSAHWMAGGDAVDFGHPTYLAVALGVLLGVVALLKVGRGFVQHVAVLCGIAGGTLVCAALGLAKFEGVAQAPWVGLVVPLRWASVTFEPWSILAMSVVMLVNTIETVGVFMALSEVTGVKLYQPDIVRGFRADGLGTVLAALFNVYPYTTYSDNVGLLIVTRVRSRFITATAGGLLVGLALLPKLSAVAASVPVVVLGAVSELLFGMICVAGIRILAKVDYDTNPANAVIVAVSVGLGTTPSFAPTIFQSLPPQLAPLLQSGVVLTCLAAVGLNLLFNGRQSDTGVAEASPSSSRGRR